MPASVLLFRGMLIASVLTGLIGGFIDVVFPSLIPAALNQAFEDLPPPAPSALFGASALIFVTFGGIVAAIIGLYLFQPWSRRLAVWMTVLGWLFYPLFGVSMQSGWAQLLLEVSSTLWGAVLAMSFVSSLNGRFVRRPRRHF